MKRIVALALVCMMVLVFFRALSWVAEQRAVIVGHNEQVVRTLGVAIDE